MWYPFEVARDEATITWHGQEEIVAVRVEGSASVDIDDHFGAFDHYPGVKAKEITDIKVEYCEAKFYPESGKLAYYVEIKWNQISEKDQLEIIAHAQSQVLSKAD